MSGWSEYSLHFPHGRFGFPRAAQRKGAYDNVEGVRRKRKSFEFGVRYFRVWGVRRLLRLVAQPAFAAPHQRQKPHVLIRHDIFGADLKHSSSRAHAHLRAVPQPDVSSPSRPILALRVRQRCRRSFVRM